MYATKSQSDQIRRELWERTGRADYLQDRESVADVLSMAGDELAADAYATGRRKAHREFATDPANVARRIHEQANAIYRETAKRC
jgi:hypothetical protein